MVNEDVMKTFQSKLEDMFRSEDSSFNWGVYRIINQRNKDIEDFITKEIPNILKESLSELSVSSLEQIEKDIQKVKQSAQDTGIHYEESPRYHELLEQKSKLAKIDSYEIQVYNYLLEFFSRYYQNGDFISRFYFKNDSYVVPYDGSEVYMHWLTKDQYYIKTADEYKRLGIAVGNKTAVLKVVEACYEKNNKKEKGKKLFLLDENKPFEWNADSGELAINLNYLLEKEVFTKEELKALGSSNEKRQLKLNEQISTMVNTYLNDNGIKLEDQMVFEKALNKFQRRYTEDYFIHKDLKNFLENELEYYMQNEIIKIDSLIDHSGNVNKDLVVITKSFRNIAQKIITRLAAIEDLKKKVWEKKKFVLETNYVITLDKIVEYAGEEYLDSISDLIITNEKQVSEWKECFGVDVKSKNDFIIKPSQQTLGNGKDQWRKLPIDTINFESESNFKINLLVAISSNKNVDEVLDGVMINSENWQALKLMRHKYAKQIKCIYIDPPYNTGDSEIIYKNEYLQSSWLSLIENRLTSSTNLLSDEPVVFIAIDDFEMVNLCELVDTHYPYLKREMIVVNHHPQGGKAVVMSNTHEYMLTLVSQDSSIVLRGREKKEEVENRPFKRSGTAESNYRYGRPNSFYAILIDPENDNEVVGIEKPPKIGSDYPLSKTPEGYMRVYPISKDNGERVWRRSYESCIDLIETKKLYCSKNLSIYQIIDDEDRHSTLFTNWTDKRYNAGTYGANLLKDIIGDKNSFSYPKSIYTVEDAIYSVGSQDFWVLDYFAGSGTTAHAVLNINKDGGNLKFFLVEMGDYFDTVTKPRIKKVMYSDNWKDGKPQDMSGIGGFFKYHTLEQYEDALENVEFKQTDLSSFIKDRDVLFRYNFDHGTAESKTFLGADVENNMNFEIVTLGKNMEKVPTSVDLIESFNYIIGLWVDKYIVKENEGRRYIALKGKVDDETVFVVWRDPSDIDNIKDRKFIEREIIVGEEYSRLYVNSDYAPEESAMQKYYNIFDEWQKRLW